MAKNISIIYLDRNKFECMVTHQTNSVLYNFSPQTVKDFEVLNKDLLYSEMHLFITNTHLSPHQVIIILSNNVVFEKDLSTIDPQKIPDEILLFLEKVPFENTLHKVIKINKKAIVVATNKIYIDLLKETFEKDQCKILFVIPESVCGDLVSQKGLNPTVAKKIIDSIDSLKQYDVSHIPTIHTITPQSDEANSIIHEKKTHTRLIILLIFFSILIGILIVLIFISTRPSSKSKKLQPSTPIPTLQVTPFFDITPPLSKELITPEVEASSSATF